MDAKELQGQVRAIELSDDGKTVNLSLTVHGISGRAGPLPPGFDPWTAQFSPAEVVAQLGTAEVAQWGAAQAVLRSRDAIERGDGVEVLKSLSMAVSNGLTVPDWLARAYVSRMNRFEAHDVGSLDEAFGNKPQTTRWRVALRDKEDLIPEVSRRLMQAVSQNPKIPIDNELFDSVGRSLGIGKTLCRKYYDAGIRERGLQDLKKYKSLLRTWKIPPK